MQILFTKILFLTNLFTKILYMADFIYKDTIYGRFYDIRFKAEFMCLEIF